jgi:thymidylate synthase
MNNIDKQYQQLLQDILDYGVEKKDRTGTGTKSIFGYTIRHNMKEGFPLLTTKKMAWKSIVTELLWFLRGDTNIKFLLDNDCHIWDGDAYKNYEKKVTESILKATEEGILKSNCEDEGFSYMSQETFINQIKTDRDFAEQWGDLGPIYGKQWRSWGAKEKQFNWVVENNQVTGRVLSTKGIDQIQNLIAQLKTNPDSRRLMVSAWNVGELDQMVLPPCHYGFQCYVREGKYLSLMWNQRSVDTFLGLPFNIASYALLLEILAKAVQMVPDQLIGSLGDVHLYNNHIEQAKEQIQRKPYELSTLKMNPIFLANLEHKGLDEAINGQVNFEVEGYQSHPSIKAPLSN